MIRRCSAIACLAAILGLLTWAVTGLLTATHGKLIPIEQAVAVATEAAHTWSNTAQLYRIDSQDTTVDINADAREQVRLGADGRRRAWLVQFMDPQSGEIKGVEIRNGTVHALVNIATGATSDVEPRSFTITTEDLTRAVAASRLRPGIKWAVGYHFCITYMHERGYVIEVVGLDRSGKRNSVLFNPTTGMLL